MKARTMWTRVWSMVVGGGVGLLLLAGMAGAQPFPGGLPACTADLEACETDLGTCSTDLNACTADLTMTQADLATCTAALAACATAQQFPATGQTSCWNSSGGSIECEGTGHDGDIQAGAVLSYTDNGDGTITDNNTGLMWEKQSDDGSIHDKDNTYTWNNAFAGHVAQLNTDSCFAGHCDWRLPNVKELSSIVNYQNARPAVSAAFNDCEPGCMVECSCTAATFYWSSTSSADVPAFAWGVGFFGGDVVDADKNLILRVRAVRGGQ